MSKRKVWIISGIVAVILAIGVAALLIGKEKKADNALDYTKAPQHIGQQVTISGRIVNTSYRKGTYFLDFCADYTNCPLSLVIQYRNSKKFGDVSRFSSHKVLVKGTVTQYKGRTEIILSEPNAISIKD